MAWKNFDAVKDMDVLCKYGQIIDNRKFMLIFPLSVNNGVYYYSIGKFCLKSFWKYLPMWLASSANNHLIIFQLYCSVKNGQLSNALCVHLSENLHQID